METLSLITNNMRMADWGHLRSEFDWVYEGSVEAPYRDDRNHVPGQSALLLLEGRALVETENGAAEAHAGQWCFPSPGPRRQRFSDDARVLSIHFKLHWPGGQPLFNPDAAIVLESSSASRLEKQTRVLHRLVKSRIPWAASNLPYLHGDLQTYFIIQSGFVAWLNIYIESLLAAGVVPSRIGPIDHRVLHGVHILDDLPLEKTVDMGWLAAEVGLSPSQLDRLFTKQFKLTPRQYFDLRKLEQAIELIQSTPYSIKQVAYELGFQSLPYFCRWFQQRTGQTPRNYQESAISVSK